MDAWKARGGYRQTGLLQPLAAQSIGITRYRLTTWLHQRGLKYTEWIAQLRVEEAKRTMKAHPDWSNDAVAQHCGFTDRTVMQRTFKKIEELLEFRSCWSSGVAGVQKLLEFRSSGVAEVQKRWLNAKS